MPIRQYIDISGMKVDEKCMLPVIKYPIDWTVAYTRTALDVNNIKIFLFIFLLGRSSIIVHLHSPKNIYLIVCEDCE